MHPTPTKVTSRCLCGRVRYTAEVFLQNGYICHCTICQKSTGQPAEITVLIKAGTLEFTGEKPKYFASSKVGRRGFCAECGSRILWQASDPQDDWMTNLSVGSLDNPSEARMACHIYTDTRLPWYHLCEELPAFRELEADQMMEFIKY